MISVTNVRNIATDPQDTALLDGHEISQQEAPNPESWC